MFLIRIFLNMSVFCDLFLVVYTYFHEPFSLLSCFASHILSALSRKTSWCCQTIKTNLFICFHPVLPISYLLIISVFFLFFHLPAELFKGSVQGRFKCSGKSKEWRQGGFASFPLTFWFGSFSLSSLINRLLLANCPVSIAHYKPMNFLTATSQQFLLIINLLF